MKNLSKKERKLLQRICIAAALFVVLFFVPAQGMLRLALYLIPYLIIGYPVLWKALHNIRAGQIFDENFLMAVATLGALGCGEYPEAVAVMLFYQVGELFESVAVGKSRKSIAALMDIRPDYANVEREGQLVQVDPEEVAVGDIIVVKPGERIPLDGRVQEGESAVDTAALTGESLPRDVAPGSDIISGCVNLAGLLRIQVTHVFADSTVSRILDLVENSAAKKAKAEHFITKFARYYTPIVVFSALALAIIPSLITGDWMTWVQRGLTFLVVSCPCALVISVPLTFFGGIGGASKQGILVKGGNYLESLAKADIVVFDKTGTLTEGKFAVREVHPIAMTQEDLLELAALAEGYSDHPISLSLKAAYGKAVDLSRLCDVEESAGHGVKATVDGKPVLVGNGTWMETHGIPCESPSTIGTVIHVALEGTYAGFILISDEIKTDSAETIAALHRAGVRKTVMLTGDRKAAGEAVAQTLGLDEVYTDLLPTDKVAQVERLLAEKQQGSTLLFVGDGVNDAPVLSRADVGVAMGAMGSDAAIEAADIVLMDDAPAKLPAAIAIAKKTLRIVWQNIIGSLAIKIGVLLLVTIGVANMWWAVFADVGVMILAVLNASRMLKQ